MHKSNHRQLRFNPRSPCGERRPAAARRNVDHVSTHAPLAGSDGAARLLLEGQHVSTHAPLAGSDAPPKRSGRTLARFNPRSPCGERPRRPLRRPRRACFNPRSPCGERPRRAHRHVGGRAVSTHAPLAGSDGQADPRPHRAPVSTHAPLAGSDAGAISIKHFYNEFQPTLPLRGATGTRARGPGSAPCFNPRSPCGERQAMAADGIKRQMFQPTLPLRGATGHTLNFSTSSSSFQPTLPLRGATLVHSVVVVVRHVSTHAPLAGSDCSGFCCSCASMSFNPRSPCGERRHGDGTGNRQQGFQPTLPLRGATLRLAREVEPCDVSTHAPLAGSDCYILLM